MDESCIAYGNIRSPATSANLRKRPAVEVVFLDILSRTALRIRGKAKIVAKDSAAGLTLMHAFKPVWGEYLSITQEFVSIEIESAEMVRSPAYDMGLTREELVKTNLKKLNRLSG